MNAPTLAQATDVDYFLTNVEASKVTPEWVVKTYSQVVEQTFENFWGSSEGFSHGDILSFCRWARRESGRI